MNNIYKKSPDISNISNPFNKEELIKHFIDYNLFNPFQLEYFKCLDTLELNNEFLVFYKFYFHIVNKLQSYISCPVNVSEELYVNEIKYIREPFVLSIYKPTHISPKHFSNFISGFYNFDVREDFNSYMLPSFPLKILKSDCNNIYYYIFYPLNPNFFEVITK